MLEQWLQEKEPAPILLHGSLCGQTDLRLYGLLSSLLLRSREMGADICDELAAQGLLLPEGAFQLALFAVDDPALEQLSGRWRHRCRVNLYAAMRAYWAKILPGEVGGILWMQLGCLLGILYPPEVKEDAAKGLCRRVIAYTQKELGVSAHVTVSTVHQGVTEIDAAFREVQNFEESRAFYRNPADQIYAISEDTARRMTDGEQRARFEETFDVTAERVCGAVQAQDVRTAATHLREQLYRIAMNCKGMPYPTALNLTVNRFVSRLQYRLTDADLADWRYLSSADFSRELISCPSMNAYLAHSEDIAERLVAHHRLRTSDRHISLMLDIRSYVEENATDPNMSLTAVAREFRIKPREAAESFRAYFNESINDVLHKARVARAKELLLTTGIPVQDIAAAVGYCSLATMYRAFAHVEGVAPGKLRQNQVDRPPRPRR